MTARRTVTVATRKSALALAQSRAWMATLREQAQVDTEELLAVVARACVVLLDMMMPVMSGHDFLAALHDTTPSDSADSGQAMPDAAMETSAS